MSRLSAMSGPGGPVPTEHPQQAPRSAIDIEKEQEALLAKKYGGLAAKKKLMPKEHKFFDSADWQLSKQGRNPADAAAAAPGPPPTALPPKLEPTELLKPRRSSHLGDEEAAVSAAM